LKEHLLSIGKYRKSEKKKKNNVGVKRKAERNRKTLWLKKCVNH